MKKVISNIIRTVYTAFIKLTKKVDERAMVFISKPDYSDNARALSNYLETAYSSKDYKLYWIVDQPHKYRKFEVNGKINFLSIKNSFGLYSFRTFSVLLTAKYVLSTHNFPIPKEKGLDGQKYYLLWHGCGFKDKVGDHYTHFDKACVPGPLFIEPKSRYWKVDASKIIALGYPRYDWMLNPSALSKEFANGIKQNYSKVIIWMPTFRNSNTGRSYAESQITQFPLMATAEDWNKIDDVCVKNNVLLLIKLHGSQKEYSIDFERLSNIKKISNGDFENAGIQMYEYLAHTDALITDYSSIAFDYLVLDKPIAYALDDYEQYKKARGFVFENPLDYMPGHHIYSVNQLSAFISDVANGNDLYKPQRLLIREQAINKSSDYCREILHEFNIV